MLSEKEQMDRVKEIEQEILDVFHKLCTENHLKYSLAYGTLLGAVRHKGFIPWDDDIDVKRIWIVSIILQRYGRIIQLFYNLIETGTKNTIKAFLLIFFLWTMLQKERLSEKYNISPALSICCIPAVIPAEKGALSA